MMNEIKPNSTQLQQAAGGSSSAQARSSKVTSPTGDVEGKLLPGQEAQAAAVAQESQDVQKAKVDEAVSKLNDYVQSTQRDLHFNYDDSVEQTIVTVIDRNTDEVIRQIPNEVAVQLAQKITEDEPIRLFSAQA